MEEIDLKDLLTIFWNKRAQVILIILIFIVIGIIYTIGFTTPKYSASTSLLLAGESNSTGVQTNSITTTDVTLASKLVSTYSELVKSKNVLGQVISNLGIDEDYDSLKKNVSVSNVEDTEMIQITVTTKDPKESVNVANEIANVFIEKVANDFYNIDNVHVVDKAEENDTPSNINHKKDVIIFALIGLVVAIVYVLLSNMLDTTIKSADELESDFKLPVLASIPLYTSESNLQKKKKNGGRR